MGGVLVEFPPAQGDGPLPLAWKGLVPQLAPNGHLLILLGREEDSEEPPDHHVIDLPFPIIEIRQKYPLLGGDDGMVVAYLAVIDEGGRPLMGPFMILAPNE